MAGENLIISVGQAGNQVAASFWQSLCEEHGISPKTGVALNGQEPIGNWETFFYSPTGKKYIPRSIIVDLEPSVADSVRVTFKALFNPNNMVTGSDGAGNNFAAGYGKLGAEKINEVLLDRFQSIQSSQDCP